ncbi:MAG TPA: endopeptidase La [Candidatus Coatesbacteria bacterium]|nr:endopeptidase La [Candidatus Coatesbacteria bacterium]
MARDEVKIPGEELLKPGVEKTFPVLPLTNQVSFPHMLLPIAVEGARDTRLVDRVMLGDRHLALFTVKERQTDELYQVGTLAVIGKMLRMPDDSMRLLVQGLQRVRRGRLLTDGDFLTAGITPLVEHEPDTVRVKALKHSLLELFGELVKISPRPDELAVAALNLEDNSRLADFVAGNLSLEVPERQRILATPNVEKRLSLVLKLTKRELEVLRLGQSIQDEISEEMTKAQREFYLRQQLQAIRRELGEGEEPSVELDELAERIEAKAWPEEVRTKAERELGRLRQMSPGSAEYVVAHTYLTWLLDLPWGHCSTDKLEVKRAERILDEDHYGLVQVKDRILEFLAVRSLVPEGKGPILCLVGPPGTGKTSLGRSIARALARRFVRISLGGVHDEAEIRGHRRTYVGALPGRIIQGLKTAGTSNPVFMLDEVDKLASDFRGDPSSALLEVLDPEQNWSFRDNFIEEPYDLSRVFFITTANTDATIPRPLLDRMEVISLAGYTLEEKVQIARRYLVPRQLEASGLSKRLLTVPARTLAAIALRYTREAGVRNLERAVGAICRKVARKRVVGEAKGKLTVKVGDLADYLGSAVFRRGKRRRSDMVGVATGLVWTPTGGDIVFIEAARMEGKGNLVLTGQLGEVMQESARIATSFVRSRAKRFKVPPDFFSDTDIHIHVPAGAVPKDGPSAGVTMACALVSLLSGRPVKNDLAMTGELSLRGEVLGVGGVKEKLLAAKRAGIKTVIVPEENRELVADAFRGEPQQALAGLELIYVRRAEEAVKLALGNTD